MYFFIVSYLQNLSPISQALLAGLFTWGVTALGAATVFFMKTIERKVLDGLLGFAAGVMIAASFWSLLAPAIEMGAGPLLPNWFPAAVGFLLGGAFLRLLDRIVPHVHLFLPKSEAEGVPTQWKKSVLLVLAITIH